MNTWIISLRNFLNRDFFLLILLGGVLFSIHAQKRPRFALRLAAGLALAFLLEGLGSLALYRVSSAAAGFALLEMLRAVLQFCLAAGLLFALYVYTPMNAMYVAVLGYTIEHLVVLVSYCVGCYACPDRPAGQAGLFLAFLAAAYTAECLMVLRNREGFANINNRSVIVQSALFLFASVVLSVLSYNYIVTNPALRGTPSVFVVSAFGVLMCLSIIIGLLDSFHIKRMETELLKTRELWREDVRRYELSKETVEVLNYRYHDLKKRMALLMDDTKAGEQIRRALDDYDDRFRTGNEAMDVVLTEKSILCRQNAISLAVIADGRCFAGLGAVDLYSILGNLIENAMEYLKTVPEPDKRVIDLFIRREGDMDVIHVENYLADVPKQSDDLPVTTKPDAADHGYGLKSVRYTVKKYSGIFRIATDHHLFSATVAIPLLEKE